ncbi:MAG: hypothetical protein IKA76_00985 [Clostridia bacterium]|nr:hypothetical protein [Clostridia bacterium]
MKKQILADGIVYLICMAVAVLLNLLVSALLETIGMTFGLVEYYQRAWIRVASGFFVGCAILAALIYKECYKSLEFYPSVLIPSIALAGIVQMILAAILSFNPILAGGVRDLAGIMSFGKGFDSEAMIEKIKLPMCLAAFAIYIACEIGCALLFGYLGKKRRAKSRSELIPTVSEETEENPQA